MHVIYNGELMPEDELRLPLTNRAFQYNDGFFETAVIENGRIRFWQDHVRRMQQAAAALKLLLPQEVEVFSELKNSLLRLAAQNGAIPSGRLKLKVWRSGGGLYTPDTHRASWLATVHPFTPTALQQYHVGVCQTVYTNYSPFSHFKGPNSLIYVMAGIERQQRGFNDMLLLNRQHVVSELVSSNLFWLRDEVLYTPALDTGCVNGIARRNILRWCASEGIRVREVYFEVDRLSASDAVFAANVTGIRSIKSIEGRSFAEAPLLLTRLQEEVFRA